MTVMKSHTILSLCLAGAGFGLGLLTGCATPESRVQAHAAQFATWPAEVQAQVKAGKIEVGYTKDMVRVALGEPARRFTRTTKDGDSEVWVYFDQRPKLSIGFGFSTGGAHGAVATGTAVGDQDWRDEEVMRVVLVRENVSAIERRK